MKYDMRVILTKRLLREGLLRCLKKTHVEENVRTGEKTRTLKESTREITFEGGSDSGKREEQ